MSFNRRAEPSYNETLATEYILMIPQLCKIRLKSKLPGSKETAQFLYNFRSKNFCCANKNLILPTEINARTGSNGQTRSEDSERGGSSLNSTLKTRLFKRYFGFGFSIANVSR